jgi:hypothetical protein
VSSVRSRECLPACSDCGNVFPQSLVFISSVLDRIALDDATFLLVCRGCGRSYPVSAESSERTGDVKRVIVDGQGRVTRIPLPELVRQEAERLRNQHPTDVLASFVLLIGAVASPYGISAIYGMKPEAVSTTLRAIADDIDKGLVPLKSTLTPDSKEMS